MLFFNRSKIDILFRNINELNKLVAENIRTVEYVETGAKFLPTNVMHLTFYADGIRLDEGRFRTYAERATKSFMKDLSDGFFPSELQVSFTGYLISNWIKQFGSERRKTNISNFFLVLSALLCDIRVR